MYIFVKIDANFSPLSKQRKFKKLLFPQFFVSDANFNVIFENNVAFLCIVMGLKDPDDA
jgi:hypothetical protein